MEKVTGLLKPSRHPERVITHPPAVISGAGGSKPPELHDEPLEVIGKGAAGGVGGALVVGVGNGGSAVRHAVHAGKNLMIEMDDPDHPANAVQRVAVSTIAPVGLALAVPVVATVSAVFGLVKGAETGADKGVGGAFERSVKSVATFDRRVGAALARWDASIASRRRPRGPEGERAAAP